MLPGNHTGEILDIMPDFCYGSNYQNEPSGK